MVSNETISTINYIKDLDYEYNVKIILLLLIFSYCLFFLWVSYNWKTEYIWQYVINIFLFRAPSIVVLFLFPLLILNLFRGVSWEVLYNLVIVAFVYSIVVFLIALKVGMWTYFAELVGLDMKTKSMEIKR